MTNEKIILQLEKGYDIKNPQLAQVLTNIENNGVTKEEFTEAMETKADLVGGKVPAEQLPSYVDDVIEFDSITNGSANVETILNKPSFTNKIWYIEYGILGTTIDYTKKFVDFGANTSEEDWTIINPEEGKIYIEIGEGATQNHSYRWTGSTLIDLDKNWSDNIATLNDIVKIAEIRTVSNLDDISEGDQSGLDQKGLSDLFRILVNYKRYRNSCIQFEDENLDARLCHIVNVEGGKREFTIYNNGSLQTYKLVGTTNNFNIEKVNSIPVYAFTPVIEEIEGSTATIDVQPNHIYKCGELTSLKIQSVVDSPQIAEVIFQSGATATELSLPDTLAYVTGWQIPQANKTYKIFFQSNTATITY